MVEIFAGIRPSTSKYRCESISLDFHREMVLATIPPREHLFDQEVVRKLRLFTFQDPSKVSDGLAYIWEEKHKWQRIASAMGIDPAEAKTRLRLIANRRNAIVHESDMDPISHLKNIIAQSETDEATDFLLKCGRSIYSLVAQPKTADTNASRSGESPAKLDRPFTVEHG